MAEKLSFTDIDSENAAAIPEAPAAPAETPNTPAVQAKQEVADYDGFDTSNDGFAEELDARQIGVPRLQLAHGVGELAKLGHTPGSIVFNSEVPLVEPKKNQMAIAPEDGVTFYFLAGLGDGLDYQEILSKTKQDANLKPRAWRSEVAARADGALSGQEWRSKNNPEFPKYGPRLTLKALVECPAGVPTAQFPLEFQGKRYTLASLTLTKGGYWQVGKKLYTHLNTSRQLSKAQQIKGEPVTYPLWFVSWKLFSKHETVPGAKNGAWCLHARQENSASPEFIAWARQYK